MQANKTADNQYLIPLMDGIIENIDIADGILLTTSECIVLTGESGCGKTTLTRCINGLIPNFFEGTLTGEILYEGVPVNKLEQYEISRKIGTVFQDPRSQFFAVNTTDEVSIIA